MELSEIWQNLIEFNATKRNSNEFNGIQRTLIEFNKYSIKFNEVEYIWMEITKM